MKKNIIKQKKSYFKENKERLIKIADSIFSAVSLLFALRVVVLENESVNIAYYLFAYLFLGLSKVLQCVTVFRKNKLYFVKNVISATVLLILAGIAAFATLSDVVHMILIMSFFILLTIERVFAVIKDHRIRSIIFNVFLSFLFSFGVVSSLLFVFPIDSTQVLGLVAYLHAFVTAATSLCHIIYISFAQMRLDILNKIIKKTFAAEILFGLVLLIISFSLVFQAVETGIETFSDALWYCFAIVTTIGFGDYTVITPVGRVLSMILGVYGIIVVALITSIIVNFYNEVKHIKEKPNADDMKEEENKPEETKKE